MDVNALGSLADRNRYLFWTAKRLGLDPLLKPFDLIPGRDNKLILYANKSAADQIRKLRQLSVTCVQERMEAGVYLVKYRSESLQDHSVCENIGAVAVEGLKGDALANAMMKTHTKAQRRTILSHFGLGIPDENEIIDIPSVPQTMLPATADPPKAVPRYVDPAKPPVKV